MSIIGIVVLGVGNDDGDNVDILGGYAETRQCNVQQRDVADSRDCLTYTSFSGIAQTDFLVAVHFSARNWYCLGGRASKRRWR